MAGFRIQAICAALLGAAIALHPLASEDVFWHLASGRWILEHRTVPRTDVLTYSMTDHPWTNLQWLTDVGMASLWTWAGADGLVLGKAAAFATLGALLVAAARAFGAGAAGAGFAAMIALLASAERTFERPEVATYLLLCGTILLCARMRNPTHFFIVVAILHVLWANLHALAFLGMLTLLLFAAATTLARRNESFALGASLPFPPRTYAIASGISTIALLVNPYGIAAWTFPRTLLQRISGEEEVFSRILEFASPLRDVEDPALRFFWILLALFVLSIALKAALARTPRGTLGPLLFALPFLVLACLARRNVPLFAIAAAPLLAFQLTEIVRHLPRRTPAAWSWAPPFFALFAIAAVLTGSAPAVTGLWRDRGLGVEPGIFPESTLQVLDGSGNEGPLFNDLDFGGYISWRNPERRVWIDGRLEVAGAERLATYLEAHRNPAIWDRLQSSWGFQSLLLEHSSRGNAAFLVALLESGRWQLQHLSPEAALLFPPERTTSTVRPTLEDWTRALEHERGPEPRAGQALRFVAAPIDALLRRVQGLPRIAPIRTACRLANACLTLGWIDEARTGYLRALERSPRDPEALFNLGVCELRSGNREGAREIWESAMPSLAAPIAVAFKKRCRVLVQPGPQIPVSLVSRCVPRRMMGDEACIFPSVVRRRSKPIRRTIEYH